jgi:hypothetical protein
MDKIGDHIVKEQNTDKAIRYLAAQKQLYSIGKNTFAFQVLIAVPIPIVISVFSILFKEIQENLNWIFISYTIIATFLEFQLEDKSTKLKKIAASIQEKFDTKILKIKWNNVLIPSQIDDEIIFRYYRIFLKKNKIDKLYDWYSPDVKVIKSNIASLICQRINSTYDFTLRHRYTNLIIIMTISTFLFFFLSAQYYNLTVISFLTNVLFPSLPVFVLARKQISSNKDSIENLRELKSLIEDRFSRLQSIDDDIPPKILRQIQDKIYLKRINSPLLPDWSYNFLRPQLEEEMHFSVKEKIENLK